MTDGITGSAGPAELRLWHVAVERPSGVWNHRINARSAADAMEQAMVDLIAAGLDVERITITEEEAMNAPTIHVGDESQPVKTIVIVHCDPPTKAEPPAAWLAIDQVAQRLGVSRSKVSRLCSGGELPFRRIGSKLQVHVDEVTRYEAHLQAQAAASGRDRANVKRAARQAMRLIPSGSGGAR